MERGKDRSKDDRDCLPFEKSQSKRFQLQDILYWWHRNITSEVCLNARLETSDQCQKMSEGGALRTKTMPPNNTQVYGIIAPHMPKAARTIIVWRPVS